MSYKVRNVSENSLFPMLFMLKKKPKKSTPFVPLLPQHRKNGEPYLTDDEVPHHPFKVGHIISKGPSFDPTILI